MTVLLNAASPTGAALRELEVRFATEQACREYLARLRWGQEFVCPACKGTEAWPTERGLWMCAAWWRVGRGGLASRPPGRVSPQALAPRYASGRSQSRALARVGVVLPIKAPPVFLDTD